MTDKEIFEKVTSNWFKYESSIYNKSNFIFNRNHWCNFIKQLDFDTLLSFARFGFKNFKTEPESEEWYKPAIKELQSRDIPQEKKLEILIIFN